MLEISSSGSSISKIISYSLLVILCVIMPACIHVEFPHSGKVTDAETGEVLQDVSVTLSISYHCPYPPSGVDRALDTEEALTDEKGSYSFPFRLYALKPLCWTDKVLHFIKPGYFPSNDSKLNKMRYFLDFLYYKGTFRGHDPSKSYKAAADKMKNAELIPMGEMGVFLNLKGTRLTQIYTKQAHRLPGGIDALEMVYDDVSEEWLTLDANGNLLRLNDSKIPKWNFFSSYSGWSYSYPIYANRDTIYYPVDENPMRLGMQYAPGEVKSIRSDNGEISALTGYIQNFFTIEAHESKMCHYGALTPAERGYGFLKCGSGEDLPRSKDGESLSGAKFKFIAPVPNPQTPMLMDGVLFVVATPAAWRFYTYLVYRDRTINELPISFPSNKEITAFTATTDINGLYISFKGEGIRKYYFKWDNTITEDLAFRKNSFPLPNGDVRSLAIGRTRNNEALYAVTGENFIYRFSIEGFPDYLVRLKDQN